jgi:hypothetical protein
MLKGIYLTLLAGQTIPTAVPQVAVDALENLEITISAAPGAQSAFQLDFSLSNDSPLHASFLVASGAITPFIRIVLIATISGIPEVLIDGVVTSQSVTPGTSGSRYSMLTINGVDLTALMDLIALDGTPYAAMAIDARVRLILAKYAALGVSTTVVPPLFVNPPSPQDRIPVHKGTDYKYLNLMAKQCGYVFYLDPGPAPKQSTAYFGPQTKTGTPQRALNINMDAQTNCDELTFSFHSEKPLLPTVFIQNPLTKTPLPIPLPASNPLQTSLGKLPPVAKNVSFLNTTANLDPMDALLTGVATQAPSQDAVSANGSIDVIRYGGILHARALVGVRGAGVLFDGVYYVESVTHHLKRGEYRQDFTLSRNGLVSTTASIPA